MRLTRVNMKYFKNIIDSGSVDIKPDVTCLVGKNESGKTAFLEALTRLNPARGNPKFSVADQCLAWLEKRNRFHGENLEEVRPINTTFFLDDKNRSVVEAK